MKSSDAKASKCHNFLLKLAFLSGSYIYVQLFYINCTEKDLYIVNRVKLMNQNIGVKMLI